MDNLKILHIIRSKHEELHWLVMTSWCCHVFKLRTIPLRTHACQTADIIFHSIYGAACLQLTQFACHGCENVYFILFFIIKSEVWIVNHCLGLGHETMVCAVCLTMFLWTVYGEQYIYELQLTYAGDPVWIKGTEERNEGGARGQCHLKSYQGQGH